MLSVIMPAHNVAQSILSAISSTVATLKSANIEYELIVIDDGSSDGTYEKVLTQKDAYPNVKCIRYTKNRGKGYALTFGFRFASGDQVIFLDADADLPPHQIPRFLEHMARDGADGIIGSKRHPQSEVSGFPAARRFLSLAYNLLEKMLFNLPFNDTQAGIKLFKRETLEKTLPLVREKRYTFDLELLVRAIEAGYQIKEAPVQVCYLHKSRIGLRDICHMFWGTMRIFWRLRVKRG
jgi:glycosyltransferase involved in cell wall biosynthesis